MARPGKAPTSGPPEVLCPRGAQGFGNLPKDRPGLGETTYTTSESSLRTNRVLFPNTQVGQGSHLLREVSPPHSAEYILCALLRQAPQSTKTLTPLHFSGYSNHSLHCSSTTLYITLDKYGKHICTLQHLLVNGSPITSGVK